VRDAFCVIVFRVLVFGSGYQPPANKDSLTHSIIEPSTLSPNQIEQVLSGEGRIMARSFRPLSCFSPPKIDANFPQFSATVCPRRSPRTVREKPRELRGNRPEKCVKKIIHKWKEFAGA